MSRLGVEFITGCAGAIHVTSFLPEGPVRAAMVVAQPFAEEANKSRRMVALVGRALADRRVAVYVPDCHGCGDSEGDFADATWPVWRQDLLTAAALAGERHQVPVIAMGVRLGALLVADVLPGLPDVDRLVFWQPLASGGQALTQFLRLRAAAGMMGNNRESVNELRQRLEAGEALEVAGYTLSPELARALMAVDLQQPPPRDGARGQWFWLAGTDTVPPPLDKAREQWSAAGWDTGIELLNADAFWATQEIATVPALVERTAAAVDAALA